MLGMELARTPVDEFNAIVGSLKSDYQALGTQDFIEKHIAELPAQIEENVSKILSGEYKFTQVRRDDWQELDEGDECRKPCGNIYYKKHDRVQQGFHKVEVPIEEIPDRFREVYKFKLILDSDWH